MAKAKVDGKRRSLLEYAQAKRREGCPVCALPPEIRAELAKASKNKIKREDQLGWLRDDCKAKITDADLSAHNNGRHYAQVA